MKFVLVLFAIYSLFTGLRCADPDQNQENVEDTQEPQPETGERFGYSHAVANAVSRPMSRPPAQPLPLSPMECYICTDCPEVSSNTTTKLCPYSLDPSKQNKCVTYAEQYTYTKRSFYVRGCATERGSCSDIRKAHATHTDVVKIVSCHECEGHKCNSASLSLIDMSMAILTMVVSSLVAKYTLS